MPTTEVRIFAEADGSAPLLEWMDALPTKAQDKILVRIERLAEMGHELRRPEADFLRDGVYELRATWERAQHRVLYFFQEGSAVLSHGLTKEDVVPKQEIEIAIRRKAVFAANPTRHTYTE